MRAPWRRVGIGAAIALALWAGAAALLLGTAWRRVPVLDVPRFNPPAPILTRAQYGSVIGTHPRPYVYRVDALTGSVCVFGAEHTRNPDDPGLRTLGREFDAFAPTIVLIEGRLGMMFPLFMDPVRTFGETGHAAALARRASIPVRSWEPPRERIAEELRAAGFTTEQIGLRFVLNGYFSNLRHGRPDDPAAFVADTLVARAREAGASASLRSVADVDAAWVREYPRGPDWRDVSDEFGLPGVLGEMDLNAPRDAHLVSCIADLLARGERVLVVCGSSHAVVIEPAMRAMASASQQ